MGRGVVHRKVQQNKRRVAVPDSDHMMAATHYDDAGAALEAARQERESALVSDPVVQVRQSLLDELISRVTALESRNDVPPSVADTAHS